MAIEHKVTAWNIEWLDKLLTGLNGGSATAPEREQMEKRLEGISQAITEIACDILCITEGLGGADRIKQFAAGLPGYAAVTRPPGDSYRQQGNQ